MNATDDVGRNHYDARTKLIVIAVENDLFSTSHAVFLRLDFFDVAMIVVVKYLDLRHVALIVSRYFVLSPPPVTLTLSMR